MSDGGGTVNADVHVRGRLCGGARRDVQYVA